MRVALSYICLLAVLAVAGGDSPWEITNGVVTLRCSPAISRISFFGRVDGPNALWMNPQKDGAIFADSLPWINHGGERFWPIPALAFAAAFESGRPAAEFKPDQILPGAKIGFFAEKAVAVYPDCLFVQKTMLQPQFCYPEGSNVQLYGNPVGNFGKYLEIEILGESTELVSSWELLDRK